MINIVKLRYLKVVALCLILKTTNGQTIKPSNIQNSNSGIASLHNPTPISLTNTNLVRSWTPNYPSQDADDITNPNQSVKKVKQVTQYYDGLGRPIQTVAKDAFKDKINNKYFDLISPTTYDEYGRETVHYLPYFLDNQNKGKIDLTPFDNQSLFYQNFDYSGWEDFYYGKTVYENSPLNKPIKTFAPGNSWVGSEGAGINEHSISLNYGTNSGTDVIMINIGAGFAAIPYVLTNNTNYDKGVLTRLITTDEHHKRVVEYKDKVGQIVLKKVEIDNNANIANYSGWLCTHYIYDDYGLLRCVLPPKATEWALNNNWNFTSPEGATVMSELCFRYEYDELRRMITKKVPGASEVFMVYDYRNRLVMTQDGNMRSGNTNDVKWLVTKYDNFNRPIATYLWQNNDTRITHQSNAIIIDNYPQVANNNFTLLTENYYDNYSWTTGITGISNKINGNYLTNTNYINNLSNTDLYTDKIVATANTLGMITGTRTRVLKDVGLPEFIYTANFYDEKGRIVQVQTTNHLAGKTITTTQYDFSNKPLLVIQEITEAAIVAQPLINKIETFYEYDEQGRVLSIQKAINDKKTKENLVLNEYNELGQLVKKQLYKDPANTTQQALETLNYNYNIRGWLTAINKDYLDPQLPQYSTNHWFGMQLNYDYGTEENGVPKDQFNGNIASTIWKSRGSDAQRAYGFNYDAANRLLKGDFTQLTNNNWDVSAGIDFSMYMGDPATNANAYDANGNILKMHHKGLKNLAVADIDDLHYSYLFGGLSNKLQNVIDNTNDPETRLGDFRYSQLYNNSLNAHKDPFVTQDYNYDPNGNLIYDKNKDILLGSAATPQAGIIYNYLNLPQKIYVAKDYSGNTKGTIEYVYDATGNKLQKIVTDNTQNSTLITTTDYVNGLVYETKSNSLTGKPELQFFPHEEGRVRPIIENNLLKDFVFDYFIKDHLGNVRATLTTEVKPADIYVENFDVSPTTTNPFINNTSTIQLPSSFCSPSGSQSGNKGQKLDPTQASSNTVGAGIVLKVMAGDHIGASVNTWLGNINTPNQTPPTQTILENLFTNLFANALVSNGGSKGANFTTIQPSVNTGISSFITSSNGNATNGNGAAYLNYILLDEEQLNLVQANSGADELPSSIPNGNPCQNARVLSIANGQGIDIVRNGYLYIFVSSTKTDYSVYFDDINVQHIKGSLIDETAYYPFGLTMGGISSKAATNAPVNRRKFNYGSELQSQEFSDGSGLEMYDTKFRGLDPQLGRWWQVDPMAEFHYGMSPYAYVLNNPLTYNDPLGLDTVRVSGEGQHKIKIRQGDILAITIEETTSYYTYDPKNKDAVNGFVGNGITDNSVLPDVTVTSNAKPKDENSSHPFAWAPLAGFINNSINTTGGYFENFYNAKTTLGYGFKSPWYKLKAYPSGWRGNGSVSTFNISKAGKLAGIITFGVGTAIDAYGVYTYYTQGSENPNAVHPAKAGTNLGVGVYGLYGGPPGWIMGTIYFIGDATIPGGWPAAMKAAADNTQRNREILGPSWNPRAGGGLL